MRVNNIGAGGLPLLIVTMIAITLFGAMVKSVAGGFFEAWGGRPGYGGGYFQPGPYGRRR